MKITIRGYSDDGPLIEGEIETMLSGRSGWTDDGKAGTPAYLAFSDGTLIAYTYGLAGWCFDLARQGAGAVAIEKSDPAGDYGYDVRTDTVTILGDITWVAHTNEVIS